GQFPEGVGADQAHECGVRGPVLAGVPAEPDRPALAAQLRDPGPSADVGLGSAARPGHRSGAGAGDGAGPPGEDPGPWSLFRGDHFVVLPSGTRTRRRPVTPAAVTRS